MKKNPVAEASELTTLIDELMKENPNRAVVRKLMVKQGIPYSVDPITQMGTVLNLMDQGKTAKRFRKGESEV